MTAEQCTYCYDIHKPETCRELKELTLWENNGVDVEIEEMLQIFRDKVVSSDAGEF